MYQGEKFKRYLERNQIPKTKAAKDLKISRQSLYQWFESNELERSTVNKILTTYNETEEKIFGIGFSNTLHSSQKTYYIELLDKGNTFINIGNNQYAVVIPFVEESEHNTYLQRFTDEKYLSELPKHSLIVNQLNDQRFTAFRVSGDSMDNGSKESIIEGDIVVGCEIEQHQWKTTLAANTFKDYIIVHKEGILIKRIIAFDAKTDVVISKSLNPDKNSYPDFDINLAEVSQIFNVVSVTKPR